MPNIYWLYKNLAENAISITESTGTSNTNFGTANLKDFDLNTSFRSNSGEGTTTSLLFDFGTAVYIDSIALSHELPIMGTFVLRAGTASRGTVAPNDFIQAVPISVVGTSAKYFSSQGYRYWKLDMKSYIIPNGNFEFWSNGTASNPDDWVLTGTTAGAVIARENSITKIGSYSAKVTRVGANTTLEYTIPDYPYYRGRATAFAAWVYSTKPNTVRIGINDGFGNNLSSYHTGGTSWERLPISHVVSGTATDLKVLLFIDSTDTSGYIDGAGFVEGTSVPMSDFTKPAGYHEIKELFLGKRLELSVNPTYPFNRNELEDVNFSLMESGQRYSYHNFGRKGWELNYPAIGTSDYENILNMRRYTKGSYKPLWMCIDPSKPFQTEFIRIVPQTLTYREIIAGAYDVSFQVEQEL